MAEQTSGAGLVQGVPPAERAPRAVADLYHAYFTGLILTLVSRRGSGDAARWMHAVFRHQHHEKFLSSFEKLGLSGMPHAVACAAYHYLSNSIGGVGVEFMKESDRKAWVRFVPPRWIYMGAAICGVPSEVSRGFLTGWYAQNGVSLKNPRLGFVCTAQTVDGQHGLAGYFMEYDHDLAPEERLVFRPGEIPPPFDPDAAPRLPAGDWTSERLARAYRNYAMEYVRSGLPRLMELFGETEGAHLGHLTGRMIGAQLYKDIANAAGVQNDDAEALAQLLAWIAEGEGDSASITRDGDSVLLSRTGWRLMRGIANPSQGVLEAWNGLIEGLAMVHNRFLTIDLIARVDHGAPQTVWRIQQRPHGAIVIA
ncbi:hypothetical protein [Hyphomicrobium sp. CS1BSMeth3]|uniref:hypothetical protein n=1 Tax=Hyphomicrobium sp. CS1BSMeth3 TaxID=1892844 RepID=UPI000931E02A|nr:hypothetical protein [Hyphomicrobium sp. CS1BSMeth3]